MSDSDDELPPDLIPIGAQNNDDSNFVEAQKESHSSTLEVDNGTDNDDPPTAIKKAKKKDPTPLSIVTGWLGAGKTTLVRSILDQFGGMGKKIAIIQNEFSDLGVEDALELKDDTGTFGEMLELSNGCVCCSVRSDFVVALEILMKRTAFDYILVECSGLADPGPLARMFWVDDELESSIYLDGVISVVDAKHLPDNVRSDRQESKQVIHQIAYADRILLNKVDLVIDQSSSSSSSDASTAESAVSALSREELRSHPALASLISSVRNVNSVAPIIPTVHSKLELKDIMWIKAFDEASSPFNTDTSSSSHDRNHNHNNDTSKSNSDSNSHSHSHDQDHKHSHDTKVGDGDDEADHPHDHSINSFVIEEKGSKLKGGVTINQLNWWMASILWGAGEGVSEDECEDDEKNDKETNDNGKNKTGNADGENDANSTEVFRIKAVLNVIGCDKKVFLQGVQKLFDVFESDECWASEDERDSRIVFIGRHLSVEKLKKGFKECIEKSTSEYAKL